MAGNTYLSLVNGIKTLLAAIQSSAGVGDAGKIPALNSNGVLDSTIVNSKVTSAGASDSGKIPAADATGKLDMSYMPIGLGAETDQIIASEALSAGDWVNVYSNAGVANVRKADATVAGKECNGFVLSAVAISGAATVYRSSQSNNQLSGLTPGHMYWLSTTAGTGIADIPPSSSGNVVQSLGKAVSATTVIYNYSEPVTLA